MAFRTKTMTRDYDIELGKWRYLTIMEEEDYRRRKREDREESKNLSFKIHTYPIPIPYRVGKIPSKSDPGRVVGEFKPMNMAAVPYGYGRAPVAVDKSMTRRKGRGLEPDDAWHFELKR